MPRGQHHPHTGNAFPSSFHAIHITLDVVHTFVITIQQVTLQFGLQERNIAQDATAENRGFHSPSKSASIAHLAGWLIHDRREELDAVSVKAG